MGSVSIHAPAWGATYLTVFFGQVGSFNPRARVGRDFNYFVTLTYDDVSIHAPAWGATEIGVTNNKVSLVSIHAPAWGATIPMPTAWGLSSVSIHAPAWGATPGLRNLLVLPSFQSTRPRGARL